MINFLDYRKSEKKNKNRERERKKRTSGWEELQRESEECSEQAKRASEELEAKFKQSIFSSCP